MTRTAQRAQALAFLAVALPTFVAMAGLAIDGALLLTQRRLLQSTVDGAARAGATRLDMELMRASGGGDVQVDIALARTASNAYLADGLNRALPWWSPPEARIEVTRTRVRVTVEGSVPTAFMRIVGVDQVAIGATADAAAQHGIRAPTQ